MKIQCSGYCTNNFQTEEYITYIHPTIAFHSLESIRVTKICPFHSNNYKISRKGIPWILRIVKHISCTTTKSSHPENNARVKERKKPERNPAVSPFVFETRRAVNEAQLPLEFATGGGSRHPFHPVSLYTSLPHFLTTLRISLSLSLSHSLRPIPLHRRRCLDRRPHRVTHGNNPWRGWIRLPTVTSRVKALRSFVPAAILGVFTVHNSAECISNACQCRGPV